MSVLFSCIHGKWTWVRQVTNLSENHFPVHGICHVPHPSSFPMKAEKNHSFLNYIKLFLLKPNEGAMEFSRQKYRKYNYSLSSYSLSHKARGCPTLGENPCTPRSTRTNAETTWGRRVLTTWCSVIQAAHREVLTPGCRLELSPCH